MSKRTKQLEKKEEDGGEGQRKGDKKRAGGDVARFFAGFGVGREHRSRRRNSHDALSQRGWREAIGSRFYTTTTGAPCSGTKRMKGNNWKSLQGQRRRQFEKHLATMTRQQRHLAA